MSQIDALPATIRKARRDAYRLLRYRPRSLQEMTTRLQRRGHPAAVIHTVTDALTQSGALDDRQFATLWARSRAMSAHGSRAIARELAAHGVARAVITEALAMLRSEYDERAAARQWAERRLARYRREPVPTQWRRLSAQLARRGFPAEIIEETLRECLKTGE